MVGRRGQMSTEFLLMLALLTIIGYVLMRQFTPADGGAGSIGKMSESATTKIAADQ